ncbi:MAG: ABC transporter permease [Planctomycetota bacterium]|jgi:ribose/xylose/arabinose/galactoside ABC-type transport system permease subunit|nr:ABC transporter permease [Planctomycetota bacterium]
MGAGGKKGSVNFADYMILIVLAALILFFGFYIEAFRSSVNLINILRQVSIVGIAAVGGTLVMLTGGIDLSAGAVIGMSGMLLARLLKAYPDAPDAAFPANAALVCVLVLVVCVLIGFLNAFFINQFKIPPLITTLGAMTALRGGVYLAADRGLPIFGFTFKRLGQGTVGPIPIPVIIMIVVFTAGWIFLNTTRFGRYVYGVGGNEEASRLSGINVKGIRYMVYSLAGLMSGLAGLVLVSRIHSAQPRAGTGYEMDIITAVVLGGVSITGGEGRISFVVVGVLIMGVLTNGLILINVNEYWQQVIKGLVLIAAVGFDRYIQYRRSLAAQQE